MRWMPPLRDTELCQVAEMSVISPGMSVAAVLAQLDRELMFRGREVVAYPAGDGGFFYELASGLRPPTAEERAGMVGVPPGGMLARRPPGEPAPLPPEPARGTLRGWLQRKLRRPCLPF